MRSLTSLRRNDPFSSGLSLLELLVVLILLAIGVTLALPNISPWIEKYRVQKAARQLVTDLQHAKLMAVSHKIQHRVFFDVAGTSYRIEQGNAPTGSTAWFQIGIPRSLSDPENPHYARGVALTTSFTGNMVIFSARGTASPAGTVSLIGTNYTRHVTVILTGRIRADRG
jgi:prepilin-type N-terminal cleavage/methylation domain-containing protein